MRKLHFSISSILTLLTICISLTIVTFLSTSQVALAQNVPELEASTNIKIYPASMCHVVTSGGGTPGIYNGDGSVTNPSDIYALLVDCPVVRDSVAGNPELRRAFVHYRNNSSYVFICDLYSHSANGTVLASENKVDSNSLPGTDPKTFSFGQLRTEANGYYNFLCVIPPKSSITSYRVDEAVD